LPVFPDTVETGMVLQVLADPGAMLHNGDAELVQVGPVTLGVNRAQRQHHLGTRGNAMDGAVVGELHTCGEAAVEGHPGHQRAGQKGQIPTVPNRGNVGTKHRLPESIAGSPRA
jgi:hypothetical protein